MIQTRERKVLFVCVENAGRSQMAEGFFRKYAPRGWVPVSAGTRASPKIHPFALEVMREIGVDIDSQQPKEISQEIIKSAVLTVNMGCMDKQECPALFLEKYLEWNIEDPKGKPIEEVRKIRNKIEEMVKELCRILE